MSTVLEAGWDVAGAEGILGKELSAALSAVMASESRTGRLEGGGNECEGGGRDGGPLEEPPEFGG